MGRGPLYVLSPRQALLWLVDDHNKSQARSRATADNLLLSGCQWECWICSDDERCVVSWEEEVKQQTFTGCDEKWCVEGVMMVSGMEVVA